MGEETTGLVEAPRRNRRILGRFTGDGAGPSLVSMAGIHGNEGSGIEAARRVLEWLETKRPRLWGEVVFLAGNLPALEENLRFIDVDLNRQWTPAKVAAVLDAQPGPNDPVEHAQQRELFATLRDIVGAARGPLYFLDHHTSSADGPPFLTIGDTLRNRSFARAFPLPLILGLEEQVDGALLEMLNNRGFVTMGVEGGRHDATEAADHHESVMWLALVVTGILRVGDAPDLEAHRNRLRAARRGAPRVIEVRHRHPTVPKDGFRMRPGYDNFQAIERGEILADDGTGPIRAPERDRILLPLYQGLGDDGFFVSREVRRFWMGVSTVLRSCRLYHLMRFLPGVRREPEAPDTLIVDTRVARIYPLEVFHLMGFRKVRQVETNLVVSRRRYDIRSPDRVTLDP